MRPVVAFLLYLPLACGLAVPAQQQTGAPAGIPAPALPADTPPAPGPPQAAASAVFRVRVLDGRNGSPLRNAHLTLWYDELDGAGTLLTTNADGTAAMPAPLGQPQRVLVRLADLVDCRRSSTHDVPAGFNLQAIAQHGESSGNQCGPVGRHPTPGELVLFARSPRWYEGINQGSASR